MKIARCDMLPRFGGVRVGGSALCPGYGEGPGNVCSPGLGEVWLRRCATLPCPLGHSTIAVPGLSFRVRNGTGRLPWAMAAAKSVILSAGGGSGTGSWTRVRDLVFVPP